MADKGTPPSQSGVRVLDVKNVTVRFEHRTVVEDVTFHVPVGWFLFPCWPNGAGRGG